MDLPQLETFVETIFAPFVPSDTDTYPALANSFKRYGNQRSNLYTGVHADLDAEARTPFAAMLPQNK